MAEVPATTRAAALADRLAGEVDVLLARADRELVDTRPGEEGPRQPVHTVYVPADRLTADLPSAWGSRAIALLDEHAPDPHTAALATGLDDGAVAEVYDRVRAKLAHQPVEDLRVDFEDGYGLRDDAEEDAAAAATADLLGTIAAGPGAPFVLGARVKSLESATRRRGLRTLSILLERLQAAGPLPPGLVTTLPKVTSVDQVAAFVQCLERLEATLGLPAETLRFEIQVETPQAVLGADGAATVARMLRAARGRCRGLHYGTYDYSAALGIPAAYQSLDHPAADHAKAVMQVAAAGTGVHVSDGSTNVLPEGGRDAVHAAWRTHARLVTRALERGYYQGWDLHSGHLVTRHLATHAFFRTTLAPAATRLRAYLRGARGGILDEPATAQALAAAVLRGVDCGAVDGAEAAAAVDTDLAELVRLTRRAPRASA